MVTNTDKGGIPTRKKAAKKKAAKKKAIKKAAPRVKHRRGANVNETSKAKARKLENQEKALQFRIAGLSYSKIAGQIGCSKSQAHNYVVDALKESTSRIASNADDLRTLELERLDRLIAALWTKSIGASPSHVQQLLKVMEDRRKLAGIAPAPEVFGEVVTESGSESGGVSVRVRFVKPE